MKDIEARLLNLLGERDFVPLNVPELLRRLRLPPNRQQDLQRVLRELEQAGRLDPDYLPANFSFGGSKTSRSVPALPHRCRPVMFLLLSTMSEM